MVGAAVTPAPPRARAGSSRRPADGRRPSAAAATSCSRWGR